MMNVRDELEEATMSTADSHRPNIALWVSIAVPALTIVASVITLYVSAIRAEPELPANYHWEGAALDTDIAEAARAQELGVTGQLRIDSNNGIAVDLRVHDPASRPASLDLRMTHATLPALDRQITLQRDADGVYRAHADSLPNGHWLIELGVRGQWKVRGDLPAGRRSLTLGRAPS